MKGSFRIFLSIYIGCSVTLFLSLYYGPKGLSDYRILQRYEQELNANIATLRKQSMHLEQELQLISGSHNNLVLESRNLGYHGSDEGIIRVSGVERHSRHLNFGRIQARIDEDSGFGSSSKLLGLCVALFVFLFSGILKRIARHDN